MFTTGGVVLGGTIGKDALGLGVGMDRGGIERDGRTLAEGEAWAAGVAVAAGADAPGDEAGGVVGEGAMEGVGRSLLGEAVATGVALAAVAVVGAAVGVAECTGEALGAVVAVAAGVGATVDAGVADAVVVAGGTNFFGGAFGGGVASARILVRARSAAERSDTEVQPFSTFTSVTRSFTRRGRKTLRTSLRIGTEICNSAPLTRGGPSKLCSRRSR